MKYQSKHSVICLGNPKRAALYFDRIIPTNIDIIMNPEIPPYKLLSDLSQTHLEPHDIRKCMSRHGSFWDIFFNFSKDLADLEDGLLKSKGITGELEYYRRIEKSMSGMRPMFGEPIFRPGEYEAWEKSYKEREKYAQKMKELGYEGWDDDPDEEDEICHNKICPEDVLKTFRLFEEGKTKGLFGKEGLTLHIEELLLNFLSFAYIENLSLINESSGKKKSFREAIYDLALIFKAQNASLFLPPFGLTHSEATEDDITLTMADIPIIDTSKTDWGRIIEFRKDAEARKNLRSFRLFFHTNYEGKSRNYIEDDLGRRLEDYYETCRNYAFETKMAVLSMVLDSKSLIATIAASAGVALFGEPIVAGTTLLGGASIEIAKITLEILKRKHAFHKISNDHELAYIIKAKTELD